MVIKWFLLNKRFTHMKKIDKPLGSNDSVSPVVEVQTPPLLATIQEDVVPVVAKEEVVVVAQQHDKDGDDSVAPVKKKSAKA